MTAPPWQANAAALFIALFPAVATAQTTPGAFLGRGTPTFVAGTRGDARTDRVIAGQIRLIRGLLAPGATVVNDTEMKAWPERPILYGGPHQNAALARLTLPFQLTAGRLVIGGQTFTGDAIALVTVVPAAADHPELLLLGSTGSVAEINSIVRGDDPILVADAFGPLVTGTWRDGAAVLGTPSPRIAWRAVSQGGHRFLFPEKLPPAADEAQVVEGIARGLRTAQRRLEIARPRAVSVYVYPDPKSKLSLTGRAGDGHAVVFAGALHVIQSSGLESLVVHEATHVLGADAWGPAGTPLVAEGLAVWTAGQYGGVGLAEWRTRVTPRSIRDLLGAQFRKLPEAEAYPIGALLVDAAVRLVGLKGVRDHLLGATAETWDAACKKAGTTAEALERATFAR